MRFVTTAIIFLLISTPGFSGPREKDGECLNHESSFGRLPLYFIENRGQMDEAVSYYVQGLDKTLYFTSRGLSITLKDEAGDPKKRWAVKLDFVGADPSVKPEGEDEQSAVFSYFKGKPDDWKKDIPTYGRVIYRDLWPGIDLVYSGTVNRLKYEFVVKPGADPSKIRLAYRGVSGVSVDESGSLKVTTPVRGFEDGVPYAFQTTDGRKKEISMRYALEEEPGNGAVAYGFEVGSYDPDLPLVLDPVLLVYCGYIGGSAQDDGRGIAVDKEGNAYVGGSAQSTEASFPIKVGPDLSHNGLNDVYVAKVNAAGTDLVYCGYIGGSRNDYCIDIAVDDQGNVYVTGDTNSQEDSFPVYVGPDITFNGMEDAFVAKINKSGTSLDYCGFLGGGSTECGWGIAVDDAGCAYVTGGTYSTQTTFPVKVGPDLTHNGNSDVFIAKVDQTGKDLVYCGFIGGNDNDDGESVAVDGIGAAYLVGTTRSKAASFPVVAGPDLTYNGGVDVFVAKVKADATGLEYCGYIGGDSLDQCGDTAVDGEGSQYVTGDTSSDETTFPVFMGPDLTYNAGPSLIYYDCWVAKVNNKGTRLDYCGYIGGAKGDSGAGIAVDSLGRAYVTGYASSDENSFPVAVGPDLTHNGNTDVFVARVAETGTGLDFCGYIGGASWEEAKDIALDSSDNMYVTGVVNSDESSFPVAAGPDLTFNGGGDGFVAKLGYQSLYADADTISASTGGSVNFTLTAGMINANRDYLLLGSISGTVPGTPLPGGMATLPLNWDLFMTTVALMINTPPFHDFMGTLDGSGMGSAQLNLGPVPGAAGIIMHFAYALNRPWDFASNPVAVEIVP